MSGCGSEDEDGAPSRMCSRAPGITDTSRVVGAAGPLRTSETADLSRTPETVDHSRTSGAAGPARALETADASRTLGTPGSSRKL